MDSMRSAIINHLALKRDVLLKLKWARHAPIMDKSTNTWVIKDDGVLRLAISDQVMGDKSTINTMTSVNGTLFIFSCLFSF
jgi:hypothetical protein